MRVLIAVVLASLLTITGCAASTESGDKTGTIIEIVDEAGGGIIQGTIRIVGTEGYLAAIELDDGTAIEAELSGFDEPMQVKTGETKVMVEQQAGKWVVLGVSE